MRAHALGRRIAIHVAVLSSYVVVALIHLRPLAWRLTETIPRGERMDVLLHGWIINWTARQLARAPWDLFQANLFFPHADALAYTEHMVPEALPVVPVWAFTHDPVITYNVAYLLTFVLGGWGTFLLVRRLTGYAWAAWLAGVFACFFPAKRWSMAHVNTIAVHGVPFAMLALHRLLETPTANRAFIAGVLVALASLVSAYYTIYLPLLLAVAVPAIWWAERHPLDRRRVATMALAAGSAAIIAVPLLIPYLQTWTGGDEPARSYDLQIAGAADVAELFMLDSMFWSRWLLPDDLGPLTTPFFPGIVAVCLGGAALLARRSRSVSANVVAVSKRAAAVAPGGAAGSETPAVTHRSTLLNAVRTAGYGCGSVLAILSIRHLVAHHRAVIGSRDAPAAPATTLALLAVTTAALLLATERHRFSMPIRALWSRLVGSPRLARAYAATAAFAMLIALGPRLKFFGYEGPILPYHWIYYWFPGASALRAPYRAGILGQAFVAVLLGFGAAWLLGKVAGRGRAFVAVALGALMVAESAGDRLPLRDLPRPASDVYEWIAEQPGDFGILDWPISSLMDNTAPGQWLSTLHWKRRVTGHNGRLPADVQELHALSQQWPPTDSFLDRLRDEFPVRYVVVHLHAFEPDTRRELVEEILPAIASRWRIDQDFGEDLLVRVVNGGPGDGIERRFAGWMVRGTLVVRFAEPVPADGNWRIGAAFDDAGPVSEPLPPGATEFRLPIGESAALAAPVRLRLSVTGPNGRTIRIEQITFETPEGLIYP